MTLHFTGFSNAFFGAPSAFLEKGRSIARRARPSSAPPPPPAPVREATVAREMKLTRSDSAMECQLRIEGTLDVRTATELRQVFESILEVMPRKVTLDLEGLTTLDSSGVGAIVSLFKRVNAAGGTVVVTGVKNQPLAVCKLLKLELVFGI